MELEELVDSWVPETVTLIVDLTKDCKSGVGKNAHRLANGCGDAMTTLQSIVDLTQD